MTEANQVKQEKFAAVPTVEAVLVIVVTFFVVLFLGSLFFLVLGSGVALILSELLILIIPLGYMLVKRVDIKRYIGLEITPKVVMLGFGLGVMLLFINIIVSAVLISIFGVSQAVEESNAIITELSNTTEGLIAVIIALSLAGVCEEFAFRGFFQSTLTRKYSFIPAVFASAFVFGLFHFDIQLTYIFSALIAGLVLGYIYYRWNSYVIAATAHSTVNLLVLVTLLFLT